MKVILIQGLLAPYRYPIFEELARTKGWQFEVWFMGKSVKNRIWKESTMRGYRFKYHFLPGLILNFSRKDVHPFWLNHSIFEHLGKAKPDVVIMMGWDSLTSFLVHLYCQRTGVKFVLFADSTPLEMSWRRSLTYPLVAWHVRTADALVAGGSRSANYLTKLGADKQKLYISHNTIDIEKYEEQTEIAHAYKYQTLKELHLLGKKVILYYGQLIERKGVDVLLAAYRQVKRTHPKAALLIIGDGPVREELVRIISQNQLQDVLILNNPGDEQIATYYALATIFVLPSKEEVWGLVVNEAMAASLPVIVSDHAGSAPDLVENGVNGYTFPSGNSLNLASKINTILDDPELQKKMRQASSRKIQSFLPSATVTQFQQAVINTFALAQTKLNFISQARPDFISIIIPSYRNEAGLKDTLLSLKNQADAPPYEIIVEPDPRGTGSYQTRNRALLRARGSYLAFIDAGTTASTTWLRRGYSDLKHADYVGGPIDREKRGKSHESWAELFGRHREFPVEEFMHDLHFTPTTNLFVKRAVIEQLGAFDGRLHSSGDLEFGDRVYRTHLFRQMYDRELIVTHPFRSYEDLMGKQVRLGLGSHRLGHLHPKRFKHAKSNFLTTLAQMVIPPFWLLTKPTFQKLALSDKTKIFLMTYHLGTIHHLAAIRHAHSRAL